MTSCRSTSTYRSVNHSKVVLNQSRNLRMGERFLGWPCVGRSSIAHKTGVSVSATTPESTMDDAIVKENWR
ncbi:hypothetical protein D3C72_1120420 [compost metagenome]